jgi:two-component system NtrC family sensor kinase
MELYNHFTCIDAKGLLANIMEASTEYGIIATDTDDNIILWNKGAEIIYGYSSKKMIGNKAPIDLHKKDEIDTDLLFLIKSSDDQKIIDYETEAIRKDGSSLTVSLTASPRYNESGKQIGYLIIVRDITQEKIQNSYKDALIEISYIVNMTSDTKFMLSQVLNKIKDFIGIEAAYICLYDNKSNNFVVTSQIGISNELNHNKCNFGSSLKNINDNIKGCFLSYSQYIIHSEPVKGHLMYNFIKDEKLKSDDYTIIHIPLISDIALHGILHVIVTEKRKDIFINESQILSLIANEISAGLQRKGLEDEIRDYADNLEKKVDERTRQLREKDAQLVQSGKLATLGEMATGIAHEINQPLGGISLMTQGLLMAKKRRKLSGQMIEDKLNDIKAQIERIRKIIDHLKDFSRQSQDVLVKVVLNDPLHDVFKLIGQQLNKKGVSLELELDDDLPPILADHNRLEQVFLNLIGNAKDALEEFEKEIEKIKKSNVKKLNWINEWKKYIIIRTYSKDDFVFFEISDNGSGIPKDNLERIFEPFYTSKDVGKGTGLGLTISYNIIKDYGGEIDVESQKGLGTTFIIKFPKA